MHDAQVPDNDHGNETALDRAHAALTQGSSHDVRDVAANHELSMWLRYVLQLGVEELSTGSNIEHSKPRLDTRATF